MAKRVRVVLASPDADEMRLKNGKLLLKGVSHALRRMVGTSGNTAANISRGMGKSSGYLSVLIGEQRKPRADVLAKVADACGYELVLRGHGEEIQLKPIDGEVWAIADVPAGLVSMADPDSTVFYGRPVPASILAHAYEDGAVSYDVEDGGVMTYDERGDCLGCWF